MFVELMPLLADRTVLITVAKVDDKTLPSRQLEDSTAGGCEGRVPLWGTVSSCWIHHPELRDGQRGGGAVLQQAGDRRPKDQGRQARGEMARLSGYRFRSNRVRLWLCVIAYNLGNLWQRLVMPKRIDHWSLASLQQRVVKTGGRLVKHGRY
jgi:hypothetical protein